MADCEIEKQAVQAFPALCEFLKKKQGQALLEDVDKVFLQLVFQKVPHGQKKTIKICLPHSIIDDPKDVCIFVRDLDKKDREYANSVQHFTDMMKRKNIKDVPTIIPLKALKLEYQPYEAKMKLSNMYSLYLADASIVHMLPHYLGKNFYGRKKVPVQVDLDVKDLKKEYEEALRTAQCILSGKGSVCNVAVAHTGLDAPKAIENIMTAVQKLFMDVPGGKDNIKSMYLKTSRSPALPLYVSGGLPENVKLENVKRPIDLDEPEEVDFVEEGKVRVRPDMVIELVTEEGQLSYIGEDNGYRSTTTSNRYRASGQRKIAEGTGNARKKLQKQLKLYQKENKKYLGQKGKRTIPKKQQKNTAKTNKSQQKQNISKTQKKFEKKSGKKTKTEMKTRTKK